MSIDQYEHDFVHLAQVDLPKYLMDLKAGMKNPLSMSEFAIDGLGVSGLCRRLGLEGDFPGCYVLMENETPIYVGISKNVMKRLRQHVRGKTHFDASLAYKIATHSLPHQHTRSVAMEQKAFKSEFDSAKEYLRSMNVVYVKITNPLVLYVFEPYCAMQFNTEQWNTFETH